VWNFGVSGKQFFACWLVPKVRFILSMAVKLYALFCQYDDTLSGLSTICHTD
jgi:hypothetical protein